MKHKPIKDKPVCIQNDLFNKYLKPYNLLPTTNINFKVKGSANQVINIFSMFDKK